MLKKIILILATASLLVFLAYPLTTSFCLPCPPPTDPKCPPNCEKAAEQPDPPPVRRLASL